MGSSIFKKLTIAKSTPTLKAIDDASPSIPSVKFTLFTTPHKAKKDSAVSNMRIINCEKLEKLKKNINDFAIAVSQNDNWNDENRINDLLIQYKLRGKDIVETYTVAYKTEG